MIAVDIQVDFMRADRSGRINVRADKLPRGVKVHDHVMVGDADAQPAVARLLEVRDGRATLKILPGTVGDNRDLLKRSAFS